MRANDMLEIFQHQNFETIHALRRRRGEARTGLARLREEFECVSSDVREKVNLLKSLTAEYAVAERELRYTRNAIFNLQKKCSDIDDSYVLLQRQFEKNKELLSTLSAKKQRIDADTAKVKHETREISKTLGAPGEQKQALAEEYKDRNDLKQKMVDLLEHALSNTNLDRVALGEEMAELNDRFIESITERNNLSTRFSEAEASTNGLRESMTAIETEKNTLERIMTLRDEGASHKAAIPGLRERLGNKKQKRDGIEKDLNRRQEKFDDLVHENEVRGQAIAELEKEVLEYDKALRIRESAQKTRDGIFEQIEQAKKRLGSLFTEPEKIRNLRQEAGKKIAAAADVIN